MARTDTTVNRISVIICTSSFDRLGDVHETVASIREQTLAAHEIIVAVDNHQELFETLKNDLPTGTIMVNNTAIKGLSETRNSGIRVARGDIIAFIDDDAVAHEGWLKSLSSHLTTKDVAAAGGTITPLWPEGRRPGWWPEELGWVLGCTYDGLALRGNTVRSLIGCNMAFKKTVFDTIGLFNCELGRIDKTRGIGEDSELCLRITTQMPDSCIIYEPDAVVYHKVPVWRVKLGYLLFRSYDEGYHKSILETLSTNTNAPSLSVEKTYLRHLLLTAIPKRLRRMYLWDSCLQLGAILACLGATGTGYLKGRIKNRNRHSRLESAKNDEAIGDMHELDSQASQR